MQWAKCNGISGNRGFEFGFDTSAEADERIGRTTLLKLQIKIADINFIWLLQSSENDIGFTLGILYIRCF